MSHANATAHELVHDFFHRYATALLARDARAIAAMYAVPSLIVFPGQSVPVSDARQTEEFFAASWSQYEGVEEAESAGPVGQAILRSIILRLRSPIGDTP